MMDVKDEEAAIAIGQTWKQIAKSFPYVGIVSAAIVGVASIHESLTNPFARWGILMVDVLACLSAIRANSSQGSPILDPGGKQFNNSDLPASHNSTSELTKGVASLLAAWLTIDIGLTLTKIPVDTDPINYWAGSCYGCLKIKGLNEAVVLNVKNIVRTVPPNYAPTISGGHVAGISGVGIIEPCSSVNKVVIHGLSVHVVSFFEMTAFAHFGEGAGAMDAIEGSFVIERRNSPVPWAFSPVHIEMQRDGVTTAISFPYVVRAKEEVALRYRINASQEGFYCVRCYAEVSQGVGKHHTVEITRTPQWLGYFDDDDRYSKMSQFDSNSEQTKLVKTGDWLLFQGNEGVYNIKESLSDLQSDREDLLEESTQQPVPH